MQVMKSMAVLALTAGIAAAQTDWPTYGGDAGSTHHSTLKQIDTKNVGKLTRAWTYHLIPTGPNPETADLPPATVAPGAGRAGRGRGPAPDEEGGGGPGRGPGGAAAAGRGRAGVPGGGRGLRSEASPIVVNGVMYIPSPFNRVIALDPETGKELWNEYLGSGVNAGTRGVEYWAGDAQSPATIFFGTTDARLVALNAKTGKPVPGFGKEGWVNMREGAENGTDGRGQYSLSSPPKVYRNVVITGARVQEQPAVGMAGDTRGWDAHTGKLLWQFHSVPHPGEPGSETWRGDDWKGRSGANVWGLITVDPQLGLVYLPYGSASTDFYGGDRNGANLYANCLVALDAVTGKMKWYFQTIHHDTWDFDLQSAPILITVTKAGKKIPAVALTSKTGLVFILDRATGKPIYNVEERPVPKAPLEGDEGWPTEPWPVKPAPLSRMGFKYPDDIAKVTPEHQKFCEDLYNANGGMHNDGPFTRYSDTLTIQFPGTLGATNWHGGSYDPQLGYLFYNTLNLADVGKMVKNPPGSAQVFSKAGGGRFWNPDNYWPCQAPPWGEMVALNVNTGEYAWRVPLGVIPELEAKGLHTGTMNMGGSVSTAGGLVFISATTDHRFRAFDAKTGKILWETELESGAYVSPVTYQGKDGKQYVAIVATGGGYYDRVTGDSVISFALPQ
jgi:quinoprotein glucose dehydrogenase